MKAKKVHRDLLVEIRRAVADYMRSEGCPCMSKEHKRAAERLGKLLGVKKFNDWYYDFSQYGSIKTNFL
jgi:hypothetical protein